MNQAFTWILYLSALQGFFLALILLGNSKKYGFQGRMLGLFLVLISLSLIGRNVYFSEEITVFDYKILYLGDQIIFLFGPVSYLFFTSRLNDSNKFSRPYLHFIPALAFLFLVLPYLFDIGVDFIEIGNNFLLRSGIVEGAAILSLGIYTLLNFRLFKTSLNSSVAHNVLLFERYFLAVSTICLVSWFIGFTFRNFFSEFYNGLLLYHVVWMVLSFTLIALGYQSVLTESAIYRKSNSSKVDSDALSSLQLELDKFMKSERPYLDPELSLQSLSEISGLKKHEISKALNHIKKMSYSEYIAEFRIDHFKELISKNEHQNMTILGLAIESGFNSKTTFNTVFKKAVGQTPGEYIKKHQKIGSDSQNRTIKASA